MGFRRFVGLIAGLLLVAGGAGAQDSGDTEADVELAATPPETPLPAGGPATSTDLTVTVNCQDGENGTFEVGLSVAASPEWLGASIGPSSVTVGWDECDDDGGSNGFAETVDLEVNASRSAPAFQQGTVEVQAKSEPASAKTSVPFQAGFRGEMDVETDPEEVTMEPGGSRDLQMGVTNLGNGDITVFRAKRSTGDLDVVLPGAFTVSSLATGEDNERNTTLTVQHTCSSEGPVDRRYEVELHVTSAYALDQSLTGDEGNATWTVHVDGVCPEAEVSDPEPDDSTGSDAVEDLRNQAPATRAVGLAAAVAAAAVATRRR